MRYTLLLYYPDMRSSGKLTPEEMEEGRNAFEAFAKALDDAGVLVSGTMMAKDPDAKTVRMLDEAPVVVDGPAVQLVDPLGGAIMIDVPDEATAIDWAMKAPSLDWGPVEVRSTMARYVDGAWMPG